MGWEGGKSLRQLSQVDLRHMVVCWVRIQVLCTAVTFSSWTRLKSPLGSIRYGCWSRSKPSFAHEFAIEQS
jgi:hypothetical protein